MSLCVKPFYLLRHEDLSGLSGVGVVAVGCEFPNGKVVMQWCSYRNSFEMHDNVVNLMEIHGHNGKSELMYGNPPDPDDKIKKVKKKKEET